MGVFEKEQCPKCGSINCFSVKDLAIEYTNTFDCLDCGYSKCTIERKLTIEEVNNRRECVGLEKATLLKTWGVMSA